MVAWYYWLGAGIVALIIALIFEDSRDYLLESLEYIYTFEWWSDLWDFISAGFEDIGELSFWGLGFGLLSVMLIFYIRGYTITPFVQYYQPFGRVFWTALTYIIVFIGGYLLGRAFENT